ncbi:MAG TPA: carboxymuconolactone decarboxylase family protein [Gammaproteobacteria bacterium]
MTKRTLVALLGISCVLGAGRLAAQAAARVAPVPASEWGAELEAAADTAPAGMSNLVGVFAHYPELGEMVLRHMHYLWSGSTLPERHRALLALRTAWLARSEYLWAHRVRAAREEGLDDDEIERVARGPAAGWDEFEAALLLAADELHVDSFISDATWQKLSARYDVIQLIDTIDTVGGLTMYAGLVNSLGVELEPGIDEPMPDVPHAHAAERTNVRLVDGEPRIPPVESEGGRGGGANVFRTFVRNPPADRVRGAINGHVNGNSTLSPRHREMLLIRIGVLCRSEYEYAAHVRVGQRLGMTDDDVALLLAGPDGAEGDPLELALLRAADELYEDDAVSDETWATLAASLDTRQLFDVLIAVGGYRSTSMLINSAGVQLDANMADFRFPLELR